MKQLKHLSARYKAMQQAKQDKREHLEALIDATLHEHIMTSQYEPFHVTVKCYPEQVANRGVIV